MAGMNEVSRSITAIIMDCPVLGLQCVTVLPITQLINTNISCYYICILVVPLSLWSKKRTVSLVCMDEKSIQIKRLHFSDAFFFFEENGLEETWRHEI